MQGCNKENEIPETNNNNILFIDRAPEERVTRSRSLANGDYAHVGSDNFNAFVKRIDDKGKLLWSYRHPDVGSYADLAEDTKGNIIAVGLNQNSNPKGLIDGLISKFGSDGELLWQRTLEIDSSSSTSFDFVCVNPDNNDLIVSTHHLSTNGFSTFYITMYNANGEFIKLQNINKGSTDLLKPGRGVVDEGYYEFLSWDRRGNLLVRLNLNDYTVGHKVIDDGDPITGDFVKENDYLVWIEQGYTRGIRHWKLVRYSTASGQFDSMALNENGLFLRLKHVDGISFLTGDLGGMSYLAQLNSDYTQVSWERSYDLGNTFNQIFDISKKPFGLQIVGSFYRTGSTQNYLLNLNEDGSYYVR